MIRALRATALTLPALLALTGAGAAPPLDDPPDVLALRVAHPGTVEGCPGCVLVDFHEDATRTAYFVQPSPDCQLEPSELNVSRSGDSPAGSFVEIEYAHAVRERLVDCLGRGADLRVLASFEGEPLAVAFHRPALPRMYFVAGRRIARMREILAGASRTETFVKAVRVSEDAQGSTRPVLLVAPPGQEGRLWRLETRVLEAPIFAQGGYLRLEVSVVSGGTERVVASTAPIREPIALGHNFYQRHEPVSAGDRILLGCSSFVEPGRRGPSSGCSVDVTLYVRLRPTG